MFTITANFIGNFKLGDNINHNLKILTYLYARQADPADTDAWLLRKPIIILIGSVCEALLYDLHMRMKLFNREGVYGISALVLGYVRSKKIDKFEHFISSSKKHGLLGDPEGGIYRDLEELRKLRNRVHIQNEKNHFEPDELKAFSSYRQVEAEKILEKLVKILARNHPRAESATGYIDDFKIPWVEHFS